MKILLSGYGAMGEQIAQLAKDKQHEIVGIFSIVDIVQPPFIVYKSIENLPKADLIIDFSHPRNIEVLLKNAHIHKIPIVVATTGERDYLQHLMEQASKHIPVFFSANMSYGIHVLTELLKFVTPLLSSQFDIEIIERHHNKKIDAPSGTAIKLLEAIQSIQPLYTPIYDRSQKQEKRAQYEIGMSAVRGGTIVGDHEIVFAGTDEVIEITHKAQSKKVFASGALTAGIKLVTKPNGFYDFNNL